MVHKVRTCSVVTKCPKTVENESRLEGIGQIVKSSKNIYIQFNKKCVYTSFKELNEIIHMVNFSTMPVH